MGVKIVGSDFFIFFFLLLVGLSSINIFEADFCAANRSLLFVFKPHNVGTFPELSTLDIQITDYSKE